MNNEEKIVDLLVDLLAESKQHNTILQEHSIKLDTIETRLVQVESRLGAIRYLFSGSGPESGDRQKISGDRQKTGQY